MGKAGFLVLVLLIAVFLAAAVHCQDDVLTIQGQITAMDWVGSSMSVRWFNVQSGTYDEMVFSVPNSVNIFKNGGKVGFFDLHLSDMVNVRYVDNAFAGLKVISITVTN